MVESSRNKYQSILSQSPIGAARNTEHIETTGFLPMVILQFLGALIQVRRWFLHEEMVSSNIMNTLVPLFP
jgi:hypothetical protein